jgi:putative endonuclease
MVTVVQSRFCSVFSRKKRLSKSRILDTANDFLEKIVRMSGLLRTQELTMYVYLLECKNGKFYIGQTADLEKRLKRHRNNPSPYMKRLLPIELIAHKKLGSRSEAMKAEKQLKRFKKREAVLRYFNGDRSSVPILQRFFLEKTLVKIEDPRHR